LFSFFLKKNISKNLDYQFCFVDYDTRKPIQNTDIEIKVLKTEETFSLQKANKNGCFNWDGINEKITFEVQAPYYKKYTVTRILENQNSSEIIPLRKDDYGLMIHLFSNSKIKDWEKRRNQLGEMLAEDAMIFQVDGGDKSMGLEILNKDEFIDRMTLPINSLRNVKVIETIYKGEKIHRLRFILEE